MATTTNYSWNTPDDTALVKDGAAAIRSLGTAIDTTVFTNAGAAIAKTIVDAKGDIIAATAADTVSRLAVGANDTVLTADSSTATGLKWSTVSSGGLTLLSTTTLSGASTTISSISQSYTYLMVLLRDVSDSVGNQFMGLELNSETTGYMMIGLYYNNTATATGLSSGGRIVLNNTSTSTEPEKRGQSALNLYNYTSTGTKHYSYTSTNQDQDGRKKAIIAGGMFSGTSAITSLKFYPDTGTFSTGTVLIYGVK
jgi:hypothetical protein